MKKPNKNFEFHYIQAESVDPPITKIDYRGNFIKYDENNLYPQFLASLVLQSTTHGSFIELKKKAIAGLGVEIFQADGVTPFPEAQLWFNNWNEGDLDETKLEKMAADLAKYSGMCFKAHWNNAKIALEEARIKGEQTPNEMINLAGVNFDYTCFKDWRSGVPDAEEDVHSYFYSKQWQKANPIYMELPSFDGNNVVYRNDRDEIVIDDEQVLYYFKKNDNSDVYPIPSYTSSVYQILSEGLLAKNGYNAIVNGFQADGILVVPLLETEEKKQEMEAEFRRNYTGVENARKVMVMMTDGGEESQEPKWIPINSTDNPELRASMINQFSQEISTAHGSTSPSLVGLKGSTGFASDANEMIIAYNYFNFKEIEPEQKTIERFFKNYLFRYAPAEYRTAKAKIIPLKFKEMLGFIDEAQPEIQK